VRRFYRVAIRTFTDGQMVVYGLYMVVNSGVPVIMKSFMRKTVKEINMR